jgi:3-phenylpropionate/cinnamic acid dioxygenase small subunit
MSETDDRVAIMDVLARYTAALDTKNWDGLDAVFTPDAAIDYTTSGGIKGRYPEVKRWLAEVLSTFPMTQHLIGMPAIVLDGDTATSRTDVYNPMAVAQPDGGTKLFYVGASYEDRLVRTTDGWRIAERFERQAFTTLGQ